MTPILISLGSNIDKEINIPAAIALLAEEPQLHILAVSPLFATAAVGSEGELAAQPAYHNAALLAETSLTSEQLLEVLGRIEQRLGRVRSQDKFAPRPIDLDLSFYGDVVVASPKPLPDPNVVRYAHVAIPLAAVAPDWIHPQTGASLAAIAEALAPANEPGFSPIQAPYQSADPR